MWSYRWKIEKASLARKVDQELELSRANPPDPVRTSSNKTSGGSLTENAASQSEPSANVSDPVRTGSNTFSAVNDDQDTKTQDEHGSHRSEPVRTGSPDVQTAEHAVEVVLRERLRDKDTEIEFLRTQLEKAQAEVGRRATSTDDALKTIDRVVHSFELQAEANKALALREASAERNYPQATEPIRFAPESVTQRPAPSADPSAMDATVPAYQQAEPDRSRV